MRYSLSEIEAVSKKASRAAGFSWGLSEEAARSTRFLCSLGLPGCDLLNQYLQQLDSRQAHRSAPDINASQWQAAEGRLCPVVTGALAADLIKVIVADGGVKLARCAAPLLMVGIVHAALPAVEPAVAFAWSDVTVTVSGQGINVSGVLDDLLELETDAVQITSTGDTMIDQHPVEDHAEVDEQTWQQLHDLAFQTYVPSSAASRAGAGSSLSDND